MNALSRLCRKRLGFDPADLSPDDLQRQLPDIFEALLGELDATAETLVVVQRSAKVRYGSVIPNPGIIRDERITAIDRPADSNAVFDSVIPIGRD